VRARAAARRGEAHPLAARVDRDLQTALGSRLEDREVAGLAVRALGARAEQHLHEARILGGATDLLGGRQRVLRRTEDRGAQARLAVEPLGAHPLVVCARERCGAVGAGHQRDRRGVVRVEDPDLRAVGVERLGADAGERPRRLPRLVQRVLLGEPEGM
jgi:hypothetical protein